MMRNEIANNGITQRNEVIITGCTPVVQIRLDRNRYPHIANLPYQEVISGLIEIIGMAYSYTGRSCNDDDVVKMATYLYQELMLDEQNLGMKHISLAEIGRCVKKSVLGQGKEMFGISVSSLYSIIADYCKGEGHLACKEIERMTKAQRMAVLKQSAVGVLIDSVADLMANQNNIR